MELTSKVTTISITQTLKQCSWFCGCTLSSLLFIIISIKHAAKWMPPLLLCLDHLLLHCFKYFNGLKVKEKIKFIMVTILPENNHLTHLVISAALLLYSEEAHLLRMLSKPILMLSATNTLMKRSKKDHGKNTKPNRSFFKVLHQHQKVSK